MSVLRKDLACFLDVLTHRLESHRISTLGAAPGPTHSRPTKAAVQASKKQKLKSKLQEYLDAIDQQGGDRDQAYTDRSSELIRPHQTGRFWGILWGGGYQECVPAPRGPVTDE